MFDLLSPTQLEYIMTDTYITFQRGLARGDEEGYPAQSRKGG